MAARIWSKPATQGFIKRLRDAGYQVYGNTSTGYESFDLDGKLIFKAIPGSRGYLVRYDEKVFPSKECAA